MRLKTKADASTEEVCPLKELRETLDVATVHKSESQQHNFSGSTEERNQS